ncbi:hypothetical protein [Streptomyces sp. SLBN-31]|nr:hypothetical protein [Streptomyces sp. SLBN-31]
MYHRIRSAHSLTELNPADTDWLRHQHATYNELHPDQQQLLTDIGLIAD